MQNLGGQTRCIYDYGRCAKTRALCIITGFKDLETDARKNSAIMACASGANNCKWGRGGGGYIICQQKVEEASLFWHRWRNLFTFKIVL